MEDLQQKAHFFLEEDEKMIDRVVVKHMYLFCHVAEGP